MSNLPISSKYRSTPNLPVPDAEREDLTNRLNEVYADGGVEIDEYNALLDRIYHAQTLGELAPVAEVLPVRSTYSSPAIVQQSGPAPGELTPALPAGKLSFWAVAGIFGIAVVMATMLIALAL